MKRLSSLFGLLVLVASLSFAQSYDLRVASVTIIPDTVNQNDSLSFSVGVENEDTISNYVGQLAIYFNANNGPVDSLRSDTTSIPASGTVYYNVSRTATIPPFFPGDNIVTIWPVGGGMNINPMGDSLSMNLFIDTVMSAREHLFGEKYFVIVYPNPTTEKIFIRSTGGQQTQPDKILLYDISGKFIRETDMRKSDVLDLKTMGLAEGTYLMDILLKNGRRYSVKVSYFPSQ